MTELIIDGNTIEIEPKKVAITKQIGDLLDVKDKRTTFTNKFIIPNTARNSAALDNLSVIGTNSVKPYRLNECYLIENGIPIVQKGIAIIESQGDKGFSCTIQEGNILLFDSIKGLKLSDLDYSSLTHNLTPATLTGTFSNTWTDGYIYGLSDFGESVQSYLGDINTKTQSPCLFKLWVFDKILSEAGFTYSGDVFTDPAVQTDIITMARGHNTEADAVAPVDYIDLDADDSINEVSTEPIIIDELINVTTITIDVDSVVDGGLINIIESAAYEITADITYSNESYSPAGQVPRFEIIKDGTVILGLAGTGVTTSTNYVLGGTQLEMRVRLDGEDGGFANSAIFDYDIHIDVTKVTDEIPINIADLVGGLSQEAFIKDFIQSEGLIFDLVSETEYKFDRIQDIVPDASTAIDISRYFDRVKMRDWRPTGFGKINRLSYQYESGVSTQFMDGVLTTTNETVEGDKTLFKRPFDASPTAGYTIFSDNTPILRTKLFDFQYADITAVGPTITPTEGLQFTCNLVTVNDSLTYAMTNQADSVFTGDIPVLSRSEEQGQYILDNYYAWLKPQIDKPERLKVLVNFSPLDIYNLDLLKIYYVDEIGHYFYINSAKYLTNTDTAELDITLIKSISF